MPTFDITAPDGKVIEVNGPEGSTLEQAIAYAQSIYTPVSKERTWGEAATDIGASLAAGAGQLAQLPGQIGQLAGLYRPEEAETGLQGIGKQLEQFGEESKSAGLKAREAARAQKIAAETGIASEAYTAIKETLKDPGLFTSFLAQQIPNLVGSMGGGMLTKGAVKLALRGATEEALGKAAVSGAVGTGAAMQGADIGSDTYEQIYKRLTDEGMNPEQANTIALDKARIAATEAAAISIGTAFLPGGTTIEKALVARNMPGVGGAIKGMLGETLAEATEEGGGKFVSNLQQAGVFPDVDVTKGVGEAAGMGALFGGAFGGLGGATLRPSEGPVSIPVSQEEAAPAGAIEYKPFTPVVFPDGTVANTPEDLAAAEQQRFDQQFQPEGKFTGAEQDEFVRQQMIDQAEQLARARAEQVAQEEVPPVEQAAPQAQPTPAAPQVTTVPGEAEQTELAGLAERAPVGQVITQDVVNELSPAKTAVKWINENVVGKTADEVRAMVQADPTIAEGNSSRAKVVRSLIETPEQQAVEQAKLEHKPFTPVVFPDGTIATTADQVKSVEEQQFMDRFNPEKQFAQGKPVSIEEAIPSATRQVAEPVAQGLAIDQAQQIVDNIKSGWKRDVNFIVKNFEDETPQRQAAMRAKGLETAKGYIDHDGSIVVLANNNADANDVSATVFHESLGHLGLRLKFQDELNNVLNQIYNTNPAMKRSADGWLQAHAGEYDANMSEFDKRAKGIDEILAIASEQGGVPASIMDRIKEFINRMARKIGLKRDFSDAEIRAIMHQARKEITDVKGEAKVAGKKTAEVTTPRAATNAPPQMNTKLGENMTAGQKVKDAAINAVETVQSNEYFTGLRNRFIDVSSSLQNRLAKAGMPVFTDGKLRADMLNHAKAQTINLIKTGLGSGTPYLNSDGSIAIKRSENNMARSLYLADQLDSNQRVQASGLSGRSFVAEVARALRGKDIIEDDKGRRALGIKQLQEAKDLYKETKKLAGNLRQQKINLKKIAQLRKEGYKNKKMNRELQVTPEQIAWAEKQLKDVPELKEIFGIWKNVNTSLVNLWEDVGLLTKETADLYRSNKFYVPLFKSKEDLNEDRFLGGFGTGAKSTAKLKKLEGSEAIRNIWENVDKQYAVMTALAYENQTRRTAAESLIACGAAHETNVSDPNVNLRYKVDGKDVSIVAENVNDVAAFQMMNYQLNPVMKAFGMATQVLRYGALVNPMFWVRQLIRDPIHASIVTDTMVTPLHSGREFLNIILKRDVESYQTLAERGVVGEIGRTMSIRDFLQTVGKEKAKKEGKLSHLLHRVMEVHEASDAATRVAIYKQALKDAEAKGMSKEAAIDYAVFKSRESINFSVQGNSPLMNDLRQMIPFLSASITSLDTVYRAMSGYGLNEAERKQARALFQRRALIFMAMTTAYALMYQDDDDYKKVPDYDRDNNWLIPVNMGDHKSFIKVPVPFEVGFMLKTMPEAAIRYMSGTSTGKEVAKSYALGVFHTLPTGGVPIPQAVRPGLEVITNYSFFTGSPIEGMNDQRLPVEMRGARASEMAKMLSSAGLSKIGLSPADIDALTKGYFAELGSFTTGVIDSMIYAAEGKQPPAKDFEQYAGVKAFMTNPDVNKAVATYYDLTKSANEANAAFNNMKAAGLTEEAHKFVEDPHNRQLIQAHRILNQIGTRMTDIKKRIRYVENDQTRSPEERRDIINNLQNQYNQFAMRGVKAAEAAGIR